MKHVNRIMIIILSLIMTACSFIAPSGYIQNRDKAYLSAKSIPPLRIPPGIASSSLQNSYPVSYREYPKSAENISTMPPGLMTK